MRMVCFPFWRCNSCEPLKNFGFQDGQLWPTHSNVSIVFGAKVSYCMHLQEKGQQKWKTLAPCLLGCQHQEQPRIVWTSATASNHEASNSCSLRIIGPLEGFDSVQHGLGISGSLHQWQQRFRLSLRVKSFWQIQGCLPDFLNNQHQGKRKPLQENHWPYYRRYWITAPFEPPRQQNPYFFPLYWLFNRRSLQWLVRIST